MLEKYYDAKETAKVLLSREEYRPFPKYEDRDAWAKVCPAMREQYLSPEFKKRIMDFQTSALTATAYMERYRTNGNGHDKWSPIVQPRRDFSKPSTVSKGRPAIKSIFMQSKPTSRASFTQRIKSRVV